MAKNVGIIKLKGTVDGINFYGEDLVRKAGGGFTSASIKKSPNMLSTRQYGSEFGNSSRVKRLIRLSVDASLLKPLSKEWHSGLTSLVQYIKAEDCIHPRGERIVAFGLKTALGKDLICRFLFSPEQSVYPLFDGLPDVDLDGGVCQFGNLQLSEKSFKGRATFVRLHYFVVDYDTETSSIKRYSAEKVLFSKVDLPATLPHFEIVGLPKIPSFRLAFLGVQFCELSEGIVVDIKDVEQVGLRCVGVFAG